MENRSGNSTSPGSIFCLAVSRATVTGIPESEGNEGSDVLYLGTRVLEQKRAKQDTRDEYALIAKVPGDVHTCSNPYHIVMHMSLNSNRVEIISRAVT